jgi:hypothetical protein
MAVDLRELQKEEPCHNICDALQVLFVTYLQRVSSS